MEDKAKRLSSDVDTETQKSEKLTRWDVGGRVRKRRRGSLVQQREKVGVEKGRKGKVDTRKAFSCAEAAVNRTVMKFCTD